MPKKSLKNSKQKLKPNPHLDFILKTILKELGTSDLKVYLFGSRVDQTEKISSDMDIAIESSLPLDLAKLGKIKEVFEESELPYTVDIIDLKRVSNAFRKNVLSQGVLLFSSLLKKILIKVTP